MSADVELLEVKHCRDESSAQSEGYRITRQSASHGRPTDCEPCHGVNKDADIKSSFFLASPPPKRPTGDKTTDSLIGHCETLVSRDRSDQRLRLHMAEPGRISHMPEDGSARAGGQDHAHMSVPEDDDHSNFAHSIHHPPRQTRASSDPASVTASSSTDDTSTSDRQARAPKSGNHHSSRTGQGDHPSRVRPRHTQRSINWRSRGMAEGENSVFVLEAQNSSEFNLIEAAENEVEARKIFNNYQFGLRIWKSHVTSRPISTRSEIVQELYSDLKKPLPVSVSTFRLSNILYTILIGWWLALLYYIIGCLMFVTYLGRGYGRMCFRLATYFFWPFGKFVHQYHNKSLFAAANNMNASGRYTPVRSTCPEDAASPSKDLMVYSKTVDCESVTNESASLLSTKDVREESNSLWKKPATYLWLPLGLPLLVLAHSIVFMVSWFFVLTIPIAKINGKAITKILLTAPDEIGIGNSEQGLTRSKHRHSEIIMYTHQSFNLYYYKYTVDGVNVILANLLVFVILSIVIGYVDKENNLVTPITKCLLGILAILPMTYYIGMAITTISAQSSFAVGAILNATFGSMVEVILFILMLKKGHEEGETCYMELVKSTLTGSILCCILLVPGLSMVTGGLKYRKQKFNPRSANISSSLLFVAIMGVFAPTIFSKIYGNLECDKCQTLHSNSSVALNDTGFLCSGCKTVTIGPNNDKSLHWAHVAPLMYTCAIILPLSYVIGLVFFMKTHSTDIFEEFERVQQEEGAGGHHGNAQWSRLKSGIILLLSATAIALCADMIAANIAPLLNATGMSEYFVGVTLLSIVSMLPEIVNGVQFALQNNVNLGIEIGSAAAIQVCMVQLPIIVLVDLIYPLGFGETFNDIHLWAVIFAVIIINYIFQDGKSDYFQGSIVMFIYILLMAMYFFTVTPATAVCKKT